MRVAAGVFLFAAAAYAQASPDRAAGRRIFEAQCALCHGQTGGGGRGPSLNRPTLKHAPDEKALRQVIEDGISPEMPGAWQLHPREVEAVAAYVRSLGAVPPEKLAGDPARGQIIYQRNGCAACHMLAGAGAGFGPELTDVGGRRSGSFLKQTLLDPTRTIPEDFEYLSVAGIRGIRVNEDSFTIQVKDAAGRFHSFRKSEIRDLRRLEHQTPMPKYDHLAAHELDDLVAYLAAQKGQS